LAAALGSIPQVVAVRGRGLLLAAELAPGLDAAAVMRACLDAGLIVNNVTPTALRFAPPLLVDDAEIDEAVTILVKVLSEAS
jgi:acetylornithine aminotransferase